ncbi:MAG: DUF2807 domain-containing protein [Saprospiraceae bacterium]
MKLSTKLLLSLFGLTILLSFITMFRIQQWHREYDKGIYKGNENWIEKEFPLQEFNSLEVGNHFSVVWHQGAPLVKVKIEENLKSFIKVDQTGKHVIIKFDSLPNYRTNGKIIIDVYSQSLEKIHLKDFMEFKTVDSIQGSKLELELEDHCEVNMYIKTDTLVINMYDFCELNLAGKCSTTNIRLNGHCQLDGEDIQFEQVEMQMDDFSNADIRVGRFIKAALKDHAQLNYKGDSVVADIKTRDFSNVNED